MNFKNALLFLENLSSNNSKEWFDLNRKDYEIVKKDWNEFVKNFLKKLTLIDSTIANLEPKNCIFRINRDVRFSKDKSPYKTNIGAYISAGGKNTNKAGYYIHIEPQKSFIAAGLYMPMSEDLKKVRQEIDYNFKEFNSILDNNNFKKYFNKLEGDKLKTTPKGYDTSNEAIEYLKHKSFVVSSPISDKELQSESLTTNTLEAFKELKKIIDFLNKALDN